MRNLREAIAEARRLGARVEPVSGAGEVRVSHPAWKNGRPVRLSSNRKDTPRCLLTLLRAVGWRP